MLKKIIFTTLLSASLYAQADNNISYNYFEVGYDYRNSNTSHGPYLNGSFNLNESFYLGGYYDRDSKSYIDLDQYGLFLGFHNSISDRTDFYTEFSAGRVDNNRFSSAAYGLDIGTRTAFAENFELITNLGYTHFDDSNSDGFLGGGVKGLFKFNKSNSITVGLENLDHGFLRTSIGYRYSF